MVSWDEKDLENLEPILERIESDLSPLKGKDVLVLCSGAGVFSLRLAKKSGEGGMVVGTELNEDLIDTAKKSKNQGA